MKTKYIAFIAAMLALIFLAHAAGRFTQIGGAQVASSMAFYILLALLIAPELGWGPLLGVGLAVGILTTLASSSSFPISNLVDHPLGFLLASLLTKKWIGEHEASVGQIVVIAAITLVFTWTVAALVEWTALSSTTFAGYNFTLFSINFGQGFLAWWAFGFIGVAIPTFVLSAFLAPLLYKAMRPAMIRQGFILASK